MLNSYNEFSQAPCFCVLSNFEKSSSDHTIVLTEKLLNYFLKSKFGSFCALSYVEKCGQSEKVVHTKERGKGSNININNCSLQIQRKSQRQMQTQRQKNAQSHLEVLGSWRVREMTVDRKVHVWGVVAVFRVAGCKMALVIIWLIAHSVHFVCL